MIALGALVAVYLAFLVKHLLADFFFQTGWMAIGKEGQIGWVTPLATHAGIHAVGTLAIALAVQPSLWWLGPFDFAIHSVIDRGKGLVCRHLSLSPADAGFWWAIGTDQALHQATHFAYVILLLTA